MYKKNGQGFFVDLLGACNWSPVSSLSRQKTKNKRKNKKLKKERNKKKLKNICILGKDVF